MSSSELFDSARVISLWTRLLQLQLDLGYYENNDSIAFPSTEGRTVDDTLCAELGLSKEVIFLLKHLPCPLKFDEAYETPMLHYSMAVPFTDSEWIRNSRDLDRCWFAGGDTPLRLNFMKSGDIALIIAVDEPGQHLILDTEAGTARFFEPSMKAFDSWEIGDINPERPDDPLHYRNYPARPAVDVLKELIAKFRNLEYIPMRYDGAGPQLLTAQADEDEDRPHMYTNAKIILQQKFGWPGKFNKDAWNRERNAIWRRLDDPVAARLADDTPLHMRVEE